MSKNNRQIFWIFLAIWLVFNLLQSLFTELFNDEAYYYFYSRDLAWGYYDHPPVIALLIRAGYSIFHNELGVRLFIVLLSAGTIFIVHKLSETRDELFFAVLISSFMIFQLTGFLALPDSALLFFTALFFIIYQKYSKTYSIKDGLLLGLVMAGLFYSKYLGIMIVFFTFLSNLKMMKKGSFWLAVLTTTVLFLPHLYWQYRHDFPSFYYHLTERSHDEYFRWGNFLDFIVGQAGQINPFLFVPVLYFLFKFKAENEYDRALKFAAAGSLLFPFLLMIRGRVEANWTMAGLLPLFVITCRMAESRLKFHRFVYISGIITLIAVLLVRIELMVNILPEKYTRMFRIDVHGWNSFSDKIAGLAGDRPVVFNGSYQGPSHYIFHTGKQAFSFNNAMYRGNQFDLEDIEQQLQGKEVMLVFPRNSVSPTDLKESGIELNDSILSPTGKYRYYYYEKNYRSYNFIPIDVELEDHTFKAGSIADIPVVLRNPGIKPVNFIMALPSRVFLTYHLLQYGKPLIYKKFEDITFLRLVDEYRTSIMLDVPEKPGTYYLKVSIKYGWMPPGINSRLIKIKVV
jgi:hypothetical protein